MNLFYVRSNFCDFSFINSFINQDFMDSYKLILAGYRINPQRMTREYYIKSKKAEDYKKFLQTNLLHPPHITISEEKTTDDSLYLVHHYEGKQLIKEFIDNTMIGIEFLWGGEVKLETHLIKKDGPEKIVYTVKDRKVTYTRSEENK